MILKVILLAVVATLCLSVEGKSCGEGWNENFQLLAPNSHMKKFKCLKFVTDQQVDFETARYACYDIGGKLLEIHEDTRAITEDIISVQRKYHTRFWIGFRYEMHEDGTGDFYDQQGKPLAWTNWRKGQPNNRKGNQQCIEIIGKRQAKWNDKECDAKRSYICEKVI